MHTAIICIHLRCLRMGLGVARAGTLPCAGTRAHGAVSGWAQAGPQSRGGGILAGRCKGKGFAWMYRCSEVPRL